MLNRKEEKKQESQRTLKKLVRSCLGSIVCVFSLFLLLMKNAAALSGEREQTQEEIEEEDDNEEQRRVKDVCFDYFIHSDSSFQKETKFDSRIALKDINQVVMENKSPLKHAMMAGISAKKVQIPILMRIF